MVEEGISTVYTEYPFAREGLYLAAERMARTARRGIWGGKKATQRVVGLRHDWAKGRQARLGQTPPDYLLEDHP